MLAKNRVDESRMKSAVAIVQTTALRPFGLTPAVAATAMP
jgi:hypothetical protein